MRKRINLRFALVLIVSIAVIGVGTHFLHGYQVRRNASALLEQARRAQERGDLRKAADYLSRYLGMEPADIDVLAEYGLLLADEKVATSPQARMLAARTLEKVLYREPERHDLRRRVVQLHVSLGGYASARDDLKTYLLPAFPDDAELERLLAICLEASGSYDDARTYYDLAIQHAPEDVETYARLAALLRNHTPDVRRSTETSAEVLQLADQTIDAMVQENAESYRAYLLRASYFRTFNPAQDAQKTLQAVARDVTRALDLAPEEVDVLLAAAELAREQNTPNIARDLLRRGSEIHPQEWRLFQALARLEVSEGQTDLALDWLQRGLQNQSDQMDLLWDLADLLTATGRKDEAEDTIQRLAQVQLHAAKLDFLRARLLVHEERWHEAARKLEAAYSALVARANELKDGHAAQLSERAGLMLGQSYEQIGDANQAYSAFGRVVARNGRSVPGRLGLAMARSAQGRFQEALEQYHQLLRLPEAPAAAWIEIARLTLLLNVQRDEPQRDWARVDQILKQAEQLRPLPAAVVLLRAEFWASQKEYDRARQTLLDVYDEPNSRPVEVWVGLANLEVKQGRSEAALTLLDEARRQCGDGVELRLALARFWSRQGPDQAHPALPPLAEGLDQFARADRHRLRLSLGGAFLQAGLTTEAKNLWRQAAQEQPSDLRSRLALFDLAARTGDDEAVRHWLQEIRNIEGEGGVFWRVARVVDLIGQAERGNSNGLSEARTLLASAAQRSDWSRIPLYEARIADLEKRFDAALPLYLRAIQMGERDPLVIGRTIVLLSSRGRDAEANQIARLVSDQTLLPHETQWVAAEVALRANDQQRALQLAENATTADSQNYRDHLLLGRVYWANQQPERAEPALRRARDLAPSEPATWETLVQFLAATGKMDQATAEVEAARGQLSGSAGILALARCHERVGQVDRARELYQETLTSAGEDADVLRDSALFYLRTGQFKEAQELLMRLSRHPDGPSAGWATRTRLLLLAAEGDASKIQEALAQLGNFESGLPAQADEEKVKTQRTRAQLLALQKSRADRREAIRLLEGLIERQAAIPSDYFLAAQLYEAVGDWPRARARYLVLLTLPGGSQPTTLVTVARSLLRHGEVDGAEQALRGLEQQAPQAPVTKEIRARLLHAQNQTSAAVALLQECARTGESDQRAIAGVLEELGQFPEAEELYRSSVAQSQRPENVLTLAYYLIRRQRFSEALNLCDTVWTTAPPAAVADACLAALAKMPHHPLSLSRVEARIEAVLAQAPDQVEMITALANLRNLQGRFDDAKVLYRRVLDINDRHTTALNNLAWLLALTGGNADDALALVNRAIAIAGYDLNMLDTRAIVYLALGRRDTAELAVKDLEAVVAEMPSASIFFHLAQAYTLAGRSKEARQAWEMAKQRGLSLDQLHPLEHAAYQRLLQELN